MKLRYLPVALLLALVVALGTMLLSDRLFFRALQAVVSASSDYELRIDDPELKWAPLSFSTPLLLVTPDEADAAPLFALQDVALDGDLWALLRGRSHGELRIGSLSLYIDETAPTGRPDGSTVLRPLVFIPDRLDVQSMHLIDRREDVWIFPVRSLSGERRDDGSISISTRAGTSELPLQIEAVLTPELEGGTVRATEVAAAVLDPSRASALTLLGDVEAAEDNLRYEMLLKGQYAQVADFFRAFDGDAFALNGRLEVAGTLQGDLDAMLLAVEHLRVDNMPDYRFSAGGNIAQDGSASPELDLQLRAEVGPDPNLPLLPPRLRALLDGGELGLHVSGTLSMPIIDRASLTARSSSGLELSAAAEDIRANPENLDATLASAPLTISLRADSAASLGELLDTPLEAVGAWSAKGTISGAADSYRIDDVSAETRIGRDLRATLSGAIARVARDGAGDSAALEGIALRGTVSRSRATDAGPDTEAAPRYLDVLQRSALRIEGSVADVYALRGVDLDVVIEELALGEMPNAATAALLPASGTGKLRVRRAAERWMVDDIDIRAALPDGATATLSGTAGYQTAPEGDLAAAIAAAPGTLLNLPGPVNFDTAGITATLRLRERYTTVLGEITTPHEPIQLVITGDLVDSGLTRLAVDAYAPTLDLTDVRLRSDAAPRGTNSSEDAEGRNLADILPGFPLTATLRTGPVLGTRSRLDSLVVGVTASDSRVQLEKLDLTYAGGDAQLRGVIDLSGAQPVASVAGAAALLPLGDLTRDLGIQESVEGSLSLRGGLTAQGMDGAALRSSLQGRLSVAGSGIAVSGPAYDLLMSNLLAWLAVGAGETTTRFNCAMAEFDIVDGTARSDSIYIESPRMLATGKARIELAASEVDARIEPRSRTRTIQFPSAVRIRGELSDPKVSVSPLQATGDATAQALLLLPSLTLRLFGIGPDDSDRLAPCVTTAG